MSAEQQDTLASWLLNRFSIAYKEAARRLHEITQSQLGFFTTKQAIRSGFAEALANKLARMAWAVLAKNEAYRPPILVKTRVAT